MNKHIITVIKWIESDNTGVVYKKIYNNKVVYETEQK